MQACLALRFHPPTEHKPAPHLPHPRTQTSHIQTPPPAAADTKQRNLMAAEFYGKEYVLFESGTINNTEGESSWLLYMSTPLLPSP